MRGILLRLRAALSPQALLLLTAILLLAGSMLTGNEESDVSLEKRIERTLSEVAGAGRVRVVIRTEEIDAAGGLSRTEVHTVVSGAVAVASGADNPLVRHELEEALCALLNLPPSAVNVMAGGKR